MGHVDNFPMLQTTSASPALVDEELHLQGNLTCYGTSYYSPTNGGALLGYPGL